MGPNKIAEITRIRIKLWVKVFSSFVEICVGFSLLNNKILHFFSWSLLNLHPLTLSKAVIHTSSLILWIVLRTLFNIYYQDLEQRYSSRTLSTQKGVILTLIYTKKKMHRIKAGWQFILKNQDKLIKRAGPKREENEKAGQIGV